METLGYLITGLGNALSGANLLYCLAGVIAGMVVGILPGLGPTTERPCCCRLPSGLSPCSRLLCCPASIMEQCMEAR